MKEKHDHVLSRDIISKSEEIGSCILFLDIGNLGVLKKGEWSR